VESLEDPFIHDHRTTDGKKRTECLRRVVCVEEVDDIEVEVLLQPYNVAVCPMENL